MNPLKVLALFSLVLIIGFTSSCGEDDDTEPAPTQTIAEILAADAEYSDLIGFINADAELKAYVEGETEYTLFAPTNTSFDRLRATLGVDDLSTISSSVIGAVLRFHFVEGMKLSSSLKGSSATTVQGETVNISSSGFISEAGSDADGSEILDADMKATNGVVHKVETILIPPTIFAQIGVNLGTLAQPILLGASFTDLVGIIGIADSSVPTGETALSAILADKTLSLTVFAPTNEVFDGAAASAGVSKEALIQSLAYTDGSPDPAKARAVILNHILGEGLTGDEVKAKAGTTITMETGTILMVAPTETNAQTPLGYALVNAADQTKVAPFYAMDVYKALIPDPENVDGTITLDGAVNGSIHVTAPIQ